MVGQSLCVRRQNLEWQSMFSFMWENVFWMQANEICLVSLSFFKIRIGFFIGVFRPEKVGTIVTWRDARVWLRLGTVFSPATMIMSFRGDFVFFSYSCGDPSHKTAGGVINFHIISFMWRISLAKRATKESVKFFDWLFTSHPRRALTWMGGIKWPILNFDCTIENQSFIHCLFLYAVITTVKVNRCHI